MLTIEERLFFSSVRSRDSNKVRELLANNPNLANSRILGDATCLNEQVWKDGKEVNVHSNEYRSTPALHHAVVYGYTEIVELLLDHGADINAICYENNHEMTPAIVLAAWEGGIEVMKVLLDRGADPNARSSNGVTPLSTAMKHLKEDRVNLLMLYGAKNEKK